MRILCLLALACSIIGVGVSMWLVDSMLDIQQYFDAFLWALMLVVCAVNASVCAANLITRK